MSRWSLSLAVMLLGVVACSTGGDDTDPGPDDPGTDTGTPGDGDTGDPDDPDLPPPGDGPAVVETQPADGAVDVDLGAVVRLRFDRAVDPATLASAIETSTDHPVDVAWLADELTAVVTPTVPLPSGVDLGVRVTTRLTDTAGESSPGYAFGFSTRLSTTCNVDTRTYTYGAEAAEVSASGDDARRNYVLSSNTPKRDGLPAGDRIAVNEQPDQPVVRTGHEMFDALFSMAVQEVRDNSVSEIRDGGFGGGQPTPCECFETGEKWTYVWTRDTAYAVDLGLAMIDPTRSRRSLEFKLSERKSSTGGGDLQIVQDTGSGGSYPVSTDRVVWAFGARETLIWLGGAEREAFRDRALEAAKNTIEQDRVLVYDPRDGLYRGEQSFLDWREQSYPRWTARDTVHIAMSKALSTNVGHWALLQLAADLSDEVGDGQTRDRYQAWANELGDAIRARFLRNGQLDSMVATELGATAEGHRDLLGQSLAVLVGLADDPAIVSEYPRSTIGSPVLWPQLPNIPIYHNRGFWPFVSAYSALASRELGNAAALDHDVESLIRGAALNLSNMENFDFANGANYTPLGALSGPVVNSRRQLWSVAGYVGVVVKGMFGVEASEQGLRFRPAVTGALRQRWFGPSPSVFLRNLRYRGSTVDVELRLPDCVTQQGLLEVGGVWVNGELVGDRFVSEAELGERATVVVSLIEGDGDAGAVRVVDAAANSSTFLAPREPTIAGVSASGGGISLSLSSNGEGGVSYRIYRDGERIADDVRGTSFTDSNAGDLNRTRCYTAVAVRNGLPSHQSPPNCYWGPGGANIVEFGADEFVAQGGRLSTSHGRTHYESWGQPGDTLRIENVAPPAGGNVYLQAAYGNGSGPINTGITSAAKWVEVREAGGGPVAGAGLLVLPQLAAWDIWSDSSLLPLQLDASKRYDIEIRDGLNMSYFDHFTRYVNNGGGASPYNYVNISSVKLLAR